MCKSYSMDSLLLSKSIKVTLFLNFFLLQDMNKLTPDKIEIATLRRINGKTVISVMENEEMNKLIKKFEDAEKAAEKAKQEKELQAKAESK